MFNYIEEIKEVDHVLFGSSGLVVQMQLQGYDLKTIQNNVLVKEYRERFLFAKNFQNFIDSLTETDFDIRYLNDTFYEPECFIKIPEDLGRQIIEKIFQRKCNNDYDYIDEGCFFRIEYHTDDNTIWFGVADYDSGIEDIILPEDKYHFIKNIFETKMNIQDIELE